MCSVHFAHLEYASHIFKDKENLPGKFLGGIKDNIQGGGGGGVGS